MTVIEGVQEPVPHLRAVRASAELLGRVVDPIAHQEQLQQNERQELVVGWVHPRRMRSALNTQPRLRRGQQRGGLETARPNPPGSDDVPWGLARGNPVAQVLSTDRPEASPPEPNHEV